MISWCAAPNFSIARRGYLDLEVVVPSFARGNNEECAFQLSIRHALVYVLSQSQTINTQSARRQIRAALADRAPLMLICRCGFGTTKIIYLTHTELRDPRRCYHNGKPQPLFDVQERNQQATVLGHQHF